MIAVGGARGKEFLVSSAQQVDRYDIRAHHKRRYKATTDSKHALPITQNLLDRNFTPSAPNQA